MQDRDSDPQGLGSLSITASFIVVPYKKAITKCALFSRLHIQLPQISGQLFLKISSANIRFLFQPLFLFNEDIPWTLTTKQQHPVHPLPDERLRSRLATGIPTQICGGDRKTRRFGWVIMVLSAWTRHSIGRLGIRMRRDENLWTCSPQAPGAANE